MKLVASHGAVLALCLASGACAGQAETKPPERAALRMSATTARDLQPAFSRLAHVGVNVVTEGGSSVIGLQNLQSGRIDMAMAMADVAYLAYAGQLDSSPPFDRLRGMAVVSLNTLHLLVARDAPIRAITDLQGRRIALGPRGSATALIAGLVLDAYGIPVRSVNSYELSYVETAEKLASGQMDAAFMTQIPPSRPVVTAMEAGSRLVEIASPNIEALRTRYPYLKRTIIPRAAYPHQDQPIRTIGVDLLLVCRDDVDDEVVYQILDAYFATRPASVPGTDFERAPATPIPLHAGAARYYRQRELAR